MPPYPNFIAGSSPSQSVIATSERTVNFFIEKTGGKTVMYPIPGQTPWITAASSGGILVDVGGRGGAVAGSRAFVAEGGGIYEIFADATTVKRGNVAMDSNVAQFAYLGPTANQLGIASGGNAYILNLTTNVITQVLTGECHQIGMLDEYLLALNQTTGRLRLSNLNDGTTWDPTQFALRSTQPDPWVAMVVNAPDIWLLGALTGDVWYDAGTSPFPLAARSGLNIPFGIIAPFSLVVISGKLFWLSGNREGSGLVIATDGYGPKPISSVELDSAIATYARTGTITDAEAFAFQMVGHTFYVLRFPTANATWLYDLTTGIWTELGTWNSVRGDYDVWHPRFHLAAFGKHITGESGTGQLSLLDVTTATESDGSVIRRLRRGPILINDMKRMPINRFQLVLEPGLGTQAGQGVDPVVMAKFSSDGGKTWGNERSARAGKIGQYGHQVFWNRLGSPRLWVPEVTFTDPVPFRVIDALINNAVQVAA